MGGTVRFNFGPNFRYLPQEEFRPMCDAVQLDQLDQEGGGEEEGGEDTNGLTTVEEGGDQHSLAGTSSSVPPEAPSDTTEKQSNPPNAMEVQSTSVPEAAQAPPQAGSDV